MAALTERENPQIHHTKRRTCNSTKVIAPRNSRPVVPSNTRAPAFFLLVADAPAAVPDGVAAPELPACARTHPESLSGWSQRNQG